MAEDIRKIKLIIEQYTLLTKREEIDLITTLHNTRPEYAHVLANLFEQDPRWAEQFYQNYQAKKRAAINRNVEEWNAIIENELRDISEYFVDQE
ncbi:MAG: hypothetical protein KAR24_01340 [Candidatus Pacebacteria bacterium]|nr:hypothetical protein [Candidatus Paceibacterota bacterium]